MNNKIWLVVFLMQLFSFVEINAQNGRTDSSTGFNYWRQGEYKKAAAVFQKLSVHSLMDAFNLLDCCYDWELNIAGEDDDAESFIQDANFNISMLTDGRGRTKEDFVALIEMGNNFLSDNDKNSKELAYRYFREAASFDNTGVSQFFLGFMCYDGSAPVPSKALAYFWFSESSRKGFPNGTYMVGVCCREGVYAAENKEKAFDCFIRAAKAGLASAQYDVGLCYAHGYGVAKSNISAQYWFKKAADQGHEQAKNKLNGLFD